MVEICDSWEPVLRARDFLKAAPFDTVSLVIRFGEKESAEAEIERVDKRTRELHVGYELPMARLRSATRAEVKEQFSRATSAALELVAKKYGLPTPTEMMGGGNGGQT